MDTFEEKLHRFRIHRRGDTMAQIGNVRPGLPEPILTLDHPLHGFLDGLVPSVKDRRIRVPLKCHPPALVLAYPFDSLPSYLGFDTPVQSYDIVTCLGEFSEAGIGTFGEPDDRDRRPLFLTECRLDRLYDITKVR